MTNGGNGRLPEQASERSDMRAQRESTVDWKKLAQQVLPAKLRRAIQAYRLERCLAHHKRRIARHRYGEISLQIDLADPLAAGWYDHDWQLPPEFRLLRKSRLKAGAVVFDLGAHQGVVALMLGWEVGSDGKVVAVEALAHNAVAAARNRDLNQMPWVEVVQGAVAARDGTLRICRGWNAQVASASDYAGTMEVPAHTIDSLAARYGRADVVYLDVEGMELAALEGATETLRGLPDVFVEVHTRHGLEAAGGSVGQVLAFFPDTDYQVFVHSDAAPVPVPLGGAAPGLLSDRFYLTALSRLSRS